MRAVILNGGVWLSHANGNDDDELQRQRRQYGELEKRIYRTSKTGKEGGRGKGSEKGEIESHAGKTTNEGGSGPFDATIAAAAAVEEEEEEARELWSDKEAVNALFTAAAATPPASSPPGGSLVTRLE